MKKTLLILILLINGLTGFLSAQEYFIPKIKNPQPFQTLDEIYRNHLEYQNQLTLKINEDWWQPDTVIYDDNINIIYRVLYSYSESGYITSIVHQSNENNEIWETIEIHTYEYYPNNNLKLYSLQTSYSFNNQLQYEYKIEYMYKNNLLDYYIYSYYYNGTWNNWTRSAYTYDNRNNLLCESIQIYKNNNWNNEERYVYTYDLRDNQLSITLQYWYNNQWVDEEKYIYTYDSKNNIITYQYEHEYDGQWVIEEYYKYIYNANNNVETYTITCWNSYYNDYTDFYRGICTYNTSNKLIKEEVEEKNPNLNDWTNYMQFIYNYDEDDNLVETLQKRWRENEWSEYINKYYKYDEKKNIIEYISHKTHLLPEQIETYTYEYDESNNGISGTYNNEYNTRFYINITYNSGKSVFKGDYFCTYPQISYIKTSKPAGIEEVEQSTSEITIYPNPAKDYVNISAENDEIRNVQIYNLTGKLVKQEKSNKINIIELPAGMYIIKVETEVGNYIKKVVKD